MFLHCDLTRQLNTDDIVDEFARENPRGLELANLLTESDDTEAV